MTTAVRVSISLNNLITMRRRGDGGGWVGVSKQSYYHLGRKQNKQAVTSFLSAREAKQTNATRSPISRRRGEWRRMNNSQVSDGSLHHSRLTNQHFPLLINRGTNNKRLPLQHQEYGRDGVTVTETALVVTYITGQLASACLCVKAHDACVHPRAHDDIITGILAFQR